LAAVAQICRDPDDYPVLGSAIAGQADFIVTGDDDLKDDPRLKRKMTAFGVEIMNAPEFLALLEATRSRIATS